MREVGKPFGRCKRPFGPTYESEDRRKGDVLFHLDDGAHQRSRRKEPTMKLRDMPTIVALVLVACFVALTLLVGAGAASVWASPNNGQLHLTKECSQAAGNPGDFCTFTASNLAEIPIGSRVYYDQAAGIPTGLLDSNVILDAGGGNRAVGRCTLDFATGLGLCTFSDGTGEFTGFEARVEVVCALSCTWDGTYRFRSQPRR